MSSSVMGREASLNEKVPTCYAREPTELLLGTNLGLCEKIDKFQFWFPNVLEFGNRKISLQSCSRNPRNICSAIDLGA